jgi:mycofactocin system glycosyltransferase
LGPRINHAEIDGLKEGVFEKPRELGYRLPKVVACHETKDSLQLIMPFPLKTLFLHPAWKVVLEGMSKGSFLPLEKILSLSKSPETEKIELLLDELVRKGFLEREGTPSLSEYPFVSIIVPVRNRPLDIEVCLHSLSNLVYPSGKSEILVVDDASTDHTTQVVSEFPVQLIKLKENRQAPYCRNLAAKKAKGDILAFIDSDCLADPHWLQELTPAFKDRAVGAVGGRVASFFGDSVLDRYEEVKSSLIMGWRFRQSQEHDKFFYVPSCNLLVRRDLFLTLGGFREELFVGEDVDLCWRLQDAGHYLEFRPVGTIFHRHRNRLGPFCERRFDYGTSEPLLQRLHLNRGKKIFFAAGASLFWGAAVLALVLKFIPMLYLGGIIVFADTLIRWRRVRSRQLLIRFPTLLISVLRGYFAHLYHWCAFVSRYYLIWAIPALPLYSFAFATIFFMHLFAGIMEFAIKKPRLNLFLFLYYFSLEQLSYQLGVWWGCLRNFNFRAVNPRVAWRTPVRGM